MDEIWRLIEGFFHAWGLWIAIGSALMFVVSLAATPWIVSTIPEDYFVDQYRHPLAESKRHPIIALILLIAKNILGIVLLLAGIIMLFTPGQGLLSILFGLMIMNYPGKYRLECAIISKPFIFDTVNQLRRKRGAAPLKKPNSSF